MKTQTWISLGLMGFFGATVATAMGVAGCGGGDNNNGNADAATDAVADTFTPTPDTTPTTTPDTAADTGPTFPVACTTPLPTGYTCPDAPVVKGETVCTDEAIAALVNCFGGDPKLCQSAVKNTKYTACQKCMLKDWLYAPVGEPAGAGFADIGSCVAAIDATDKTCVTAARCDSDCLFQACQACDQTAGSGARGGSTTQYGDCTQAAVRKGNGTTVPRGVCYDVAIVGYQTCAGNSKYDPCFNFDPTIFFTGACRDGGNWTHTGPTDAGVDAAGETGSDAAASDAASEAAVTDAASEAAATDAAASDAATDGATTG